VRRAKKEGGLWCGCSAWCAYDTQPLFWHWGVLVPCRYVGADLAAVCREATIMAAGGGGIIDSQSYCSGNGLSAAAGPTRSVAQTVSAAEAVSTAATPMVAVEAVHLRAALAAVRPAASRSAWSTAVVTTRWEQIGGLEDVKQRLRCLIEWPLRYPVAFDTLQIPPLRGILLHGPPGCSKTTLVQAVATASTSAAFICVSPAQVMSSYVGEAERTVRHRGMLAC
jgi:SpoVK/Ycf46/Vps4 family AAA+-type ATPase